MMSDSISMPRDNPGTGDAAQETIARQAAEIARLQSRLQNQQFAENLADALLLAATAGTIAGPVSHADLLNMIIETAAYVTGSEAAFLFLTDRRTQELVLEAGYGPDVEKVRNVRLRLGQGLVGFVAASGQPIALADAQHDPRLAADITQAVGYVPRAVLCIPLFYKSQIIGVLEFLDKDGSGPTGPLDMKLLDLFAKQAAVAIVQSRTHRNLAALLAEVIESLHTGEENAAGDERSGGSASEPRESPLRQQAGAFAIHIEDEIDYREALELAELVREIAQHGEAENKACRALLQDFAAYLRSPVRSVDRLGEPRA
jgi:GAF domain-containing protein